MFAKKPALAKEFASKTPSVKALPKYSSKGIKTKLGNAANKMFFNSRSSK